MSNEPVLIGGAVVAVLNVLVALSVFTLSVDQIALINVAIAAVFAVFIRSQVTPTAK